jgi:hypothetical protein
MNTDPSSPQFSAEISRLIQVQGCTTHDPFLFNEQKFNTLACGLFEFQFRQNHPYQRFCRARGVLPSQTASWREIPALPTAAFREFDLTSIPPQERTRVFVSSGTTGITSSRHFHSDLSLRLYETALLPPFRNHLVAGDPRPFHPSLPSPAVTRTQPRLPMVLLTPGPAHAPHSSLVHMLATACRAFGRPESTFTGTVDNTGAWRLDFDKTTQALDTAEQAGEPVLVLGTAFGFVHLADHLRQTKKTRRLPAGSRVMETGGYKGRSRELPREELHRLIVQTLGVQPDNIVCEYGMCELSSQAYDRAAAALAPPRASRVSRVFHFPPWARARIVSPETGQEVADGETGLIQVFDLANAESVLAVQTEDLGIRRGPGFEWAGRVLALNPRGCSLMQTGLS